MQTKRPSPEVVLQWMDDNGAGARKAAKHFGIPVGTIDAWTRRGIPRHAARAGHAGHAGGDADGGKVDAKGADVAAASAARPSRARPKLALDDMSPGARDRLREAVELRLDALSNPASLKDPKGSRETATALGILVDRCPDILRLIDGEVEGQSDDADRVSAAMGLPPAGPTLALVGAKEGSGG